MLGDLVGVKVLDLSRHIPGPGCTWLMAGQGAGVDIVEAPGRGDPTRLIPPFVAGVGAYFAALNRGKRSLEVDIKCAEGQAIVRQLVAHYDVLVEGFRPGVLEALALDPEDLLRINPRLIVVRISGFGGTGPWRRKPGHDINFSGLAGHLVPPESSDMKMLPLIQSADFSAAMMAAFRVATALYAREKTGRGQIIDISMTEAALLMMAPHIAAFTAEGRDPSSGQEMLTGGLDLYRCYRCGDGRWLAVAALEPHFGQIVRDVMGTLDGDELATAFLRRSRDEWAEALGEACCTPILAVSELSENPQLAARSAFLKENGATYVRPMTALVDGKVPELGEHTSMILAECGL